MLSPYEKKLTELFGGDFRGMDAPTLLGKASGFAGRGDVSGMELSWAYGFILTAHDSEKTRKEVASQLNTAFNSEDTRPKASSCLRWLSEGNPHYEDITVKKLEGYLTTELFELSVRQQVDSMERARVATDAASPSDVLKLRADWEIKEKKRKLKN